MRFLTVPTSTTFNGNRWDIDPTSEEWAKNFITNNLIDMPTKFIDENGNIITLTPRTLPEEDIPHVPEEKPNHHEPEIIDQTNNTTPKIINQTNTTTSEIENNTTIPEIINQTNTTTQETTENEATPKNTERTDVVKHETESSNIAENIEIPEEHVENPNIQSNSTVYQNNGVGENPSQRSESSFDSSQSSDSDDASTTHEIVKKDVAKKTTDSPLPYIIAIIIILAILCYGFIKYNKNDD